jgi:autoinducer 2-degrading protein
MEDYKLRKLRASHTGPAVSTAQLLFFFLCLCWSLLVPVNLPLGNVDTMSKVFLFVEINVKPGQFDEFVSKLKSHIAVIRTEAGCEFIEIYRDVQKPDVVNVWEIWSDRPSWDAHMVNENSKAWQAVGPNYVFGETITVMDAL